jgi:hypothetical protein
MTGKNGHSSKSKNDFSESRNGGLPGLKELPYDQLFSSGRDDVLSCGNPHRDLPSFPGSQDPDAETEKKVSQRVAQCEQENGGGYQKG